VTPTAFAPQMPQDAPRPPDRSQTGTPSCDARTPRQCAAIESEHFPQAFSAAQIAEALGITARAVRKRLHSAGPWRSSELPEDWRTRLAELVQQQGYRHTAHLLTTAQPTWQPSIPWPDIDEGFRLKALRAQKVFRPWLENRHALAAQFSAADFEAHGVADYAREFGETISTRHWRALFKRALLRDANREEWHRPELYLDENIRAARVSAATVAPARVSAEFSEVFAGVRDLVRPSLIEKDEIWRRAVELFHGQPDDAHRTKFKRALIEALLQKVPGLASGFNSARVIFDTRCKALLAGEATGDKRCQHNRAAPSVTGEETQRATLLAAHAGENYDGKLAPARRDLVEMGLLPASNSRSKSYVPPAERELAAPLARIGATFKRGRRAVKGITPDITRDPAKMFCNDAFTGDDFTLPVICWWNDQQGRPQIGPGQCLILADFRAWFVLGFSLQPEANYNSHVVRTLITKAFRTHGLPRFLYFERGKIWETSKLLKGDDRKGDEWHEAHSDAEVSYGLESQLGVKFIHAQSPQAKSQIEHLGAILQDMMFGEPGYTGRDQRKDLPDAVKRQIAEVKSGQAHPSKYFYSIEQWRARLRELIEKYNGTKQEGRWLKHLTPAEAFVRFQNPEDPPTMFDERCAFWLTHQVSRRLVNTKGIIKFTLTGEEFEYWNEHTVAHLAGRWVKCFFNPELPESLIVTDLDRRNPVVVPRVGMTHPVNPEEPGTRAVMGLQKRCVAALRAKYEVLRAPENRIFRKPLVAPEVQQLNTEITRQTSELQTAQREEQTARQRTYRKARDEGFAPAALVSDPERAADALDEIHQLRRQYAQEPDHDGGTGASSAVTAPGKTYLLKSAPVADVAKLRKQVWAAWHRVEVAGADVSRHALTQKTLGHNHSVNDFTAEECASMLKVFNAIARDENEKGGKQC
jgi:hypothetical protein